MKKLLSILMLLVAIVTGAKADTEWVMKNWGSGHAGLTYWSSGSSADIPSTSTDKNVPAWADGSDYDTYIGTGGASGFQLDSKTGTWKSGNPNRVFSLEVNQGDKIKVYFMGSGTGDRITYVSHNATTTNRDASTAIASENANGYNPTILTATATQTGTAYVWFGHGNRVYAIKVESGAPAGPSLSVDPAEANPFTYVAGNGPSAAQAFTVSLANSEKAVSATLSSTDYEMSKTENGTYANTAITDLANGSKVYVRLKAGLEKGTGYNGTLTFANDDVTNDAVVNLSGSVTAQTYAVTYDLKGGSGTASQDPVEAGEKITLPAAPTRDFSTFNGWLCSADDHVYDAAAEYPMTAANTKFTAQWTVTTYSSTLDFAAITKAGTTGANAIEDFLASGNMVISGKGSNSGWEESTANYGFIGYKLKDKGVTVKFMAQAGKRVTITLGSNDGAVTLKKNGVSSSIESHKGNDYFSVIAFDADEDMLVEISTTADNKKTTTLNKIEIEDALASTDVTVGTTGFATIGLPYATTIPENVTAYSLSAISSTAVTLSSAIAAGTKIPANKGFIIVANPGKYTFNQFANGTWQGDAANKLEATGASAKVAAAAGEFYYFAIINADKRKVGFKKCAANANLAANKAYLPGALVPSGSNSLEISFDGETAINGIAESEANAEVPVKVVKNGQLFIGNYNVAGARIK